MFSDTFQSYLRSNSDPQQLANAVVASSPAPFNPTLGLILTWECAPHATPSWGHFQSYLRSNSD